MSYKRLGDYIIEKVEFNEGNKYDLLQGVSNNKYFQKAKTNTIGVDLSKYRVAHHNQFVFNRATTRNGDKISIALRKGESCIVSPSYRIFEVKDENVLNPDYLMMWFKRPEFDRYARFKSHGSAHEFFDMEEMNEVELPIPSIEKQREIVAQYQAVENKIKVNEQICEKLEAAAQALYKHWFVDFEFPYSPPQEGCPQDGVVNTPSKDTYPQDGVVNTNVPRSTQNYKSLPYNPALKERAKELRKAGNLAEVLFWQQVRNRQFKGLDFDRQKIIGNYIVDFYNANYQLVVEIDGSSHNDKQEYDASRQRYLEELGVKVVRYTDIEVKRDIVSVMQHLSDYIDTIQQISPQTGETNHTLQARESNLPALEEDEINLPAFQAPLQRRGMMGYKSSGGKMVWNEELEKEIPEGWEVKSFTETVKLTGGGTPSTEIIEYWNGKIPFFTPADIQKSYYTIKTIKNITELGLKESSTKLYPKDTIFITARGTVGAIGLASCDMAMNQSCYAIKDSLPYFTHQKTLEVIERLKSEAIGAVFSALVTKDFEQQIVLEPNDLVKTKFNSFIKYFYDLVLNKSLENQKLTELQSLLLSRLARLEG